MTDATTDDDEPTGEPGDAGTPATGAGSEHLEPEGDVEGILRADPTVGPDATQEDWLDEDPARHAGG